MTQNTYQLPITFEQILTLVRQLSESEKKQLIKELNQEYRENKLTYFLEEFKTDDLTLETITAEVEAVRTEKYNQ